MTKKEIFEYEEKKLNDVIKIINKQLKKAEDNFDKQQHFIIGFKEGMRGTQFTRQALMSLYATEISDLKSIISNPYFGKFEFLDNNSGEIMPIYIGKKNITDENQNIISYDWRSPICSMYYDYNIGESEYEVNGKTNKGKILSKRQLIIKNGKLENVEEQDTLSDDQILIKYLSENADSRLKSIIATIQKEQNKIIRSPLKNNYIIQGVAGSGKTTVALHRIAYLLYNEAKNVNESEFMILGPNNYFLNYISELLPELDIKNVSQSTFEEIALTNINAKIKLESKNVTLKKVLSGIVDEEIIKYKNSIQYLKLVENFVDSFVVSHLQEDIEYEGIKLCSAERLSSIYDKNMQFTNKSYSERINNIIKQLTRQTKDNADDLCHKVWLDYRNEFLSLDKDNPRRKEIITITNEIQKEIKKGCATQIKNYFKFAKVNCLHLYQAFIENFDQYNVNVDFEQTKLKNYTLDKLEKKQIGYEDLSAILLIKNMIDGINTYEDYSHLIIDEAQDLSLTQYYMLKKIFSKATFDIYGDVNQSIYDYQSVHNWELLNSQVFNSKASLLELNKSYRTTTQISNTSNLILNYLNHDLTDCISRMGNSVKVNKFSNNNLITNIVQQINELLQKQYENIAIICKDDNEMSKVYNKLKKLGLNINKVSENDDRYFSGLCVIPSYLSKGLEFDAVIIANANNTNYTNSNIDLKLLYVAMTRAMHDLYINYNNEITEPLQSLVIEKDVNSPKILRKGQNKIIQ